METFRDGLIAKIDSIISDLAQNQTSDRDAQLQIEATVIPKHHTRKARQRTFVLGTVDVGEWQSRSPRQVSEPTLSQGSHASLSPTLNSRLSLGSLEAHTGNTGSPTDARDYATNANESRPRKAIGGLRLGGNTPQRTPSPDGTRQLLTDQRSFPKRRRMDDGPAKLQPSTIDKLIEGIWEQIHTPNMLVVPPDVSMNDCTRIFGMLTCYCRSATLSDLYNLRPISHSISPT